MKRLQDGAGSRREVQGHSPGCYHPALDVNWLVRRHWQLLVSVKAIEMGPSRRRAGAQLENPSHHSLTPHRR